MIINVWRDPYDCGASLMTRKSFDLQPGLTVLVGCNGAGKTTLLNNIREQMKEEKIPCHKFDNQTDGGGFFDSYFSGLGGEDDFNLGCASFMSSEGECIKINIGQQAQKYQKFFAKGVFDDKSYRLRNCFGKTDDTTLTNKRVLLYDAVDSGMSIDAVQELKSFFQLLIQDATKRGKELYIVISANEFELCLGQRCLDVQTGHYKEFWTYPKFKLFIMNSRRRKDKRLQKQDVWLEEKKFDEKSKFEAKKQKFLVMWAASVDVIKNEQDYFKKRKLINKFDTHIRELEDFSRNCKASNFFEDIQELKNLINNVK